MGKISKIDNFLYDVREMGYDMYRILKDFDFRKLGYSKKLADQVVLEYNGREIGYPVTDVEVGSSYFVLPHVFDLCESAQLEAEVLSLECQLDHHIPQIVSPGNNRVVDFSHIIFEGLNVGLIYDQIRNPDRLSNDDFIERFRQANGSLN